MSATPNFDGDAKALVASWRMNEAFDDHDLQDMIATALNNAWKSRGASDIATVERELSSMMGSTKAGPYIKNLDRALRKLDG